jgi:hypothetical protein
MIQRSELLWNFLETVVSGNNQQLNGWMHPALQPLARCAWIGLVAVLCVTPIVYAFSYWRMLSAIAEEPDITPAPPRWGFFGKEPLVGFGARSQLAITQFGVRTLARSRQHRLILISIWE